MGVDYFIGGDKKNGIQVAVASWGYWNEFLNWVAEVRDEEAGEDFPQILDHVGHQGVYLLDAKEKASEYSGSIPQLKKEIWTLRYKAPPVWIDDILLTMLGAVNTALKQRVAISLDDSL